MHHVGEAVGGEGKEEVEAGPLQDFVEIVQAGVGAEEVEEGAGAGAGVEVVEVVDAAVMMAAAVEGGADAAAMKGEVVHHEGGAVIKTPIQCFASEFLFGP